MRRNIGYIGTGVLVASLVAFVAAQEQPSQPRGAASEPHSPASADRAEDEAAVRRAAAEFVEAVRSGNPKAVATLWTETGEYIDASGVTLKGRAEIEAAYTRMFEGTDKIKLDVTIESIRFPSTDTAIEEGYATAYRGQPGEPVASKYSVLHVREGGKWRVALLREWPDEGSSLRDLSWLIGTWKGTTQDAEVTTVYEWGPDQKTIRCRVTVEGKDRTEAGTQILLRDPRTGTLRSWAFDDEGGFGEADWLQDGKRWVIAAAGVRPDGGELTATNFVTPLDADTFTWHSVERTLDGEELADLPPIKVRRIK